MLSTSSLSRRRFGRGDEAPVLSTSSLSRRRFGLGDEAPERIPQDSRLRLREPWCACESLVLSTSRSARESHGAMDGERPPLASPTAGRFPRQGQLESNTATAWHVLIV